MTWTALSAKVATNTITAAELNQLLGNVIHLATRPTFRIKSRSDLNDINDATATKIIYDDSNHTRHEDWDTDGTVTDAQMTTDGSLLELGDSDPGIWLAGGGYTLAYNNNGMYITRHRILKDSEVLAQHDDQGQWWGSGTGFAHTTIQDFAAGEAFAMEILADIGGTPSDPEFKVYSENASYPPTAWGLWLGSTTSNTDDYTALGTSSTMLEWWNDTVEVLNRLYSRPSAGIRASGTTTITSSWTTIALGTTEYDNAAMVSGNTLVAPVTGLYAISAGIEVDAYTDDDSVIYMRLIKDKGLGGEQATDQGANNFPTPATTDLGIFSEGLIRINDGQTITLEAIKVGGSGNETANAGGQTHLRATLITALGSITDRQFLTEFPDLTGIDFTDLDSSYVPGGLLAAIFRDCVAHLVNPPAASLELVDAFSVNVANGSLVRNEGWTKVPFSYVEWDAWAGSPFALDTENPPQHYVVPMDGLYYASLRIMFRAIIQQTNSPTANYEFAGNDGRRALRITHNGEAVARVDMDPANFYSTSWTRTTSLLIAAKKDDIIAAEVYHGADGALTLENRAGAGSVGDTRLSVAWVGHDITRAVG